MFCKYCGEDIIPSRGMSGSHLITSNGRCVTCYCSPNKKHVVSATSQKFCKYCGEALKPWNGNYGSHLVTVDGNCRSCDGGSPNRRHELA
jgi:ribosomal protein L24E